MPSQDANPNVRMLQAQTLSVTMISKSHAPERRRQVAYRTYPSTTAFVDPKHAKGGGVSMMYSDRSVRWMDSGVKVPETQVSYMQTPADFSRGRDGFDPASFAGTNAVFCRQAFDSIGGFQYGMLIRTMRLRERGSHFWLGLGVLPQGF
ncbi:unnamed protein product [Hyaloperonospora brassicae]|uniref:Uncharacterized protein n=1 Tax=Hyaloperonospora brassicae TaxID=162125 RepID=A0AAV0T239_HYABA|nr:unnamed protein product [Hyaloperonospora brassicae]